VELPGLDGLLSPVTKAVLERAMAEEMSKERHRWLGRSGIQML